MVVVLMIKTRLQLTTTTNNHQINHCHIKKQNHPKNGSNYIDSTLRRESKENSNKSKMRWNKSNNSKNTASSRRSRVTTTCKGDVWALQESQSSRELKYGKKIDRGRLKNSRWRSNKVSSMAVHLSQWLLVVSYM